jgi:lysophospholipase L1-like esterase
MAFLIPVLGLIFALALVELVFRLTPALSARKKWSDRPHLYFKPTAAASMQDFAYSDAKAPGTYRIVVAGDSFSFGPNMQFDDVFPKRLERMLSMNSGGLKAEVINKGVAGYSTRDEVNIVKQAVAAKADLVVVQMTLNDPELAIYRPKPGEPARFGPLVITKENHPILYYWKSLGYVMQRIHAEKTRGEYRKYFYDLFEQPETWNNFKSALEEIARVRDRYSMPVVGVLFPLISFGFEDDYPFFPIHQKIAALAAELKIPFLDLFEAYRGIPSDRLQVIPGKDPHPNEIAHRIAAEQIYVWLTKNSLIPAELQAADTYWIRQNAKVYSRNRCEKQPHLCFALERDRSKNSSKEKSHE